MKINSLDRAAGIPMQFHDIDSLDCLRRQLAEANERAERAEELAFAYDQTQSPMNPTHKRLLEELERLRAIGATIGNCPIADRNVSKDPSHDPTSSSSCRPL